MTHDLLSIKLCQLDDQIGKLHSRIYMSETAGTLKLRDEIDRLARECAESQFALRESLQRSKCDLAPALSCGYDQIEQVIQNTKAQIQKLERDNSDPQAAVEEQLLVAEYALDFACQAANHALLLSLSAIDAQLSQQEERKIS